MITVDLENAELKFAELRENFISFRSDLHSIIVPAPDLDVNYLCLYNAVMSYFYDIERYRAFHSESRRVDGGKMLLDDVKKAAHMVKWIVKAKPIQITSRNDELHAKNLPLVHVNESFAVAIAQAYLKHSFSPYFVSSLVYALRYRPINEAGLMLLFEHVREVRS